MDPPATMRFALPAELVFEIASHLDLNVRDINAFMQTCRFTHQTLDAMLYSVAMRCGVRLPVGFRASCPFIVTEMNEHYVRNATARGCSALGRMLDLCPHYGGASLYWIAIFHDQCTSLARLVSHGWEEPMDASSFRGRMHSAMSPEMLALLASQGADPNATNDRGETPLHRVAGRGFPLSCDGPLKDRVRMIMVLHGLGADVDARDKFGDTPLHHAARHDLENIEDIIRALVKIGADVGARNMSGETPLHQAAKYNLDKTANIISELVAHGAEWGAR